MARFDTTLVSGDKSPYTSWVFVVVPPDVVATLGGPRRHPVRGTLAGFAFRGTVARGEGCYRIPVPRQLREEAGVGLGDRVHVAIECDPDPRPIAVPVELEAVLSGDPDLRLRFDGMAPSMRRAWANHVGSAKREDTRLRRARAARKGIPQGRWPP